MYFIKPSTQFKKDIKRLQKSGRKQGDFARIKKVIDTLAIPATLPTQFKDHSLSGNYRKYRECHVFPDLLLIYYQDEEAEQLLLYRIGSHSELFRK